MRFDLKKKKLVPKEPEENNKKAPLAEGAKQNLQGNHTRNDVNRQR